MVREGHLQVLPSSSSSSRWDSRQSRRTMRQLHDSRAAGRVQVCYHSSTFAWQQNSFTHHNALLQVMRVTHQAWASHQSGRGSKALVK
jgi:hypothetical protein